MERPFRNFKFLQNRTLCLAAAKRSKFGEKNQNMVFWTISEKTFNLKITCLLLIYNNLLFLNFPQK